MEQNKKYYLAQTINSTDKGYQQSMSTPYDKLEDAITAWFVACASYRNKETTIFYNAMVVDEEFNSYRKDNYTKEQ